MKRVLIIAYAFPPEPVAGALRMGYLAKYLPEFGWLPTILTRKFAAHSNDAPFPIVRVPEFRFGFRRSAGNGPRAAPTGRLPILQFAVTLGKSILHFPDSTNGWIPAATSRALQLTRETRFQALVSSAMPASVHVVASITAALRRIPWIADFRDPWIGGRYVRYGKMRTALESGFEQRVMKKADVLTAISPSIAQSLRARHSGTRVDVIENSFDPSEWETVPNSPPQKFTITYTGTLYGGQRSAEPIFAAAARLRRKGSSAGLAVNFDFYGPDGYVALAQAQRSGLAAGVTYHGVIERAAALRVQRQSAALLILLKMDPSTRDEVGSKIFEYVGSGRYVIAVGPRESALKEVITENGLGWFASDEDECAVALEQAYEKFVRGASVRPGAFRWPVLTARDLARRFADVLDSLTEK